VTVKLDILQTLASSIIIANMPKILCLQLAISIEGYRTSEGIRGKRFT